MITNSTQPLRLFSYGTLQNKSVQIRNFGRELSGREDTLPGYFCVVVTIANPQINALTGQSRYPNVVPSSNPEDEVSGVVFEITAQELAAADKYEALADYRRTLATLKSGDQAWVYLRA